MGSVALLCMHMWITACVNAPPPSYPLIHCYASPGPSPQVCHNQLRTTFFCSLRCAWAYTTVFSPIVQVTWRLACPQDTQLACCMPRAYIYVSTCMYVCSVITMRLTIYKREAEE